MNTSVLSNVQKDDITCEKIIFKGKFKQNKYQNGNRQHPQSLSFAREGIP